MGKLGSYEFPFMFIGDAIETIRKLEATFPNTNTKPAKLDAVAQCLGHETANSGGFRGKIADLSRYKLIEGRGGVKLTELSKKVLHPKNDAEYQQSLKDAILGFPLFNELFNQLGNKAVSEAEFFPVLINITNADRAEVQDETGRIRKVYMDAIAKISNVVPTESSGGRTAMRMGEVSDLALPEAGSYKIESPGEYLVIVPRNAEKINEVISILQIYAGKLKDNKTKT